MSDHSQTAALHVEFFSKAVENKARTKLAGRPIFEDKEFVRIKFPGDKQRVHVAPAAEGYRRDPNSNDWVTYAQDYPKHYEAFRNNQEYHGDGTPLSELTFLTESKRQELRAFNVHTAEALAALDGTPLQKLGMGARELKNQAAAWLEKADGSADVVRLAAENQALMERLEALEKQMTPSTAPVEQTPTPDAVDASTFEAMDQQDIKAYIKDRTGNAPKGNPARDTLVQMAVDVANQAAA